MGAETVPDHADYRLMSRETLDALSEYHEVNLFLRGIVPMIGFKTDVVTYERHERLGRRVQISAKEDAGTGSDWYYVSVHQTDPFHRVPGLYDLHVQYSDADLFPGTSEICHPGTW